MLTYRYDTMLLIKNFTGQSFNDELGVAPSVYLQEMMMSHNERQSYLNKVGPIQRRKPYMFPPNQKVALASWDIKPDFIFFQAWKPDNQYDVYFTIRNNCKFSKNLSIELSTPSEIFELEKVVHFRRISSMFTTGYNLHFKPREYQDYHSSIVMRADNDSVTVHILALSPRPLIDFPDKIDFSRCLVNFWNTKVIQIRNIGSIPAYARMNTSKNYFLQHEKISLQPKEVFNLTIFLYCKQVGAVTGHITVQFESGERLFIKLNGQVEEGDINLDSNVIKIPDTYLSMNTWEEMTLHNQTDHILNFFWQKNESIEGDLEMFEKARFYLTEFTEFNKLKKANLEEMGLCSKKLHESVCDRALEDDLFSVLEGDFLFTCSELNIEPIMGFIWPKSKLVFRVCYHPREVGPLSASAFLMIEGLTHRPQVSFVARGLGPNIILNTDTIDFERIFICSQHTYVVLAKNIGLIEGQISFNPSKVIFGGKIECEPLNLVLQPKEAGTFCISLATNIAGPFVEEIWFEVVQSKHTVRCILKGEIINPMLFFTESGIDFGNVCLGFTYSSTMVLMNQSPIPVEFHIIIDKDGSTSAVTCEEMTELDIEIPSDPKEFYINPDSGELQPGCSVSLSIDLVSNIPRKHRVNVKLYLWDVLVDDCPFEISYNSFITQLVTEPDEIALRFAFINHPFPNEITIKNPSKNTAFYRVLPQQDKGSKLVYTVQDGKGLLNSTESAKVKLEVRVLEVGRHSTKVYLMLFGSTEPIEICTIKANGMGPMVAPSRYKLNFGKIPILEPQEKAIQLSNTSPIPAHYKAQVTINHEEWLLSKSESLIPPEDMDELIVTALLRDEGPLPGELKIEIPDSRDVVIKLRAIGYGMSIRTEPSLFPRYDIGRVFRKEKHEITIEIKNHGTKHHQLLFTTIEENRKAKVEQILGACFKLKPHKLELKGGQSKTILLQYESDNVETLEETYYCYAILDHQGRRLLLGSATISASFVDPEIDIQPPELYFKIDIDRLSPPPEPIAQYMTILSRWEGVLHLDLSVQFPFSFRLVSFDGSVEQTFVTVQPDYPYTVIVLFDPLYRRDMYTRVIKAPLTITFKDHNNVQRIVNMTGEVNFPNISLSETSVNFGCVDPYLSGSVHITMKNTSPLPLTYQWDWKTKNITIEQHPALQRFSKIHAQEIFNDIPDQEESDPGCVVNLLNTGEMQEESELSSEYSEVSSNNDTDNGDDDVGVVPASRSPSPPGSRQSSVEPLCLSCTSALSFAEQHHVPQPTSEEILTILEEFEQQADTVVKSVSPFLAPFISAEKDETVVLDMLPDECKQSNINKIVDIIPHCGQLEPQEKIRVTLTFTPNRVMRLSGRAFCLVHGGPREFLRFEGICFPLLYEVRPKVINFGFAPFCELWHTTFIVKNMGLRDFEVSVAIPDAVDKKHEDRARFNFLPGTLRVLPDKTIVGSYECKVFNLVFYPGIPGEVKTSFIIQIEGWEPIIMVVRGYAVPHQIHISLPHQIIPFNQEQMYAAIASLTSKWFNLEKREEMKSNPIKAKDHVNVFSFYRSYLDINEEFLQSIELNMAEWDFTVLNDPVPTIDDINLAFERLLCKFYSQCHCDLLPHHTIRKEGHFSLPYFTIPGYFADFGLVTTGTRAQYSIFFTNYFPFRTIVKYTFPDGHLDLDSYGLFFKNVNTTLLEPFEENVFMISLKPTRESYPDAAYCLEYHFLVEIACGASIPVYVKALIAIPHLKLPKLVDFGEVKYGCRRTAKILIKNENCVACEWVAYVRPWKKGKTPLLEVSKREEFDPSVRKSGATTNPGNPFIVEPVYGFLEPNKSILMSVHFEPTQQGYYDRILQFELNMNSESVKVRLIGKAVEPTINVEHINFGYTVPYAEPIEKMLTVVNPCSFPVEVILVTEDLIYEEERKIFQLITDYYRVNCVYVPDYFYDEKMTTRFIEMHKNLIRLAIDYYNTTYVMSAYKPIELVPSPSIHKKRRKVTSSKLLLHSATKQTAKEPMKPLEEIIEDYLYYVSLENVPRPDLTILGIEDEPSAEEKKEVEEGTLVILLGAPDTNHDLWGDQLCEALKLKRLSIDELLLMGAAPGDSRDAWEIRRIFTSAYLRYIGMDSRLFDRASAELPDLTTDFRKMFEVVLQKDKERDSDKGMEKFSVHPRTTKSQSKIGLPSVPKTSKRNTILLDIPVEHIINLLEKKLMEHAVEGILIDQLVGDFITDAYTGFEIVLRACRKIANINILCLYTTPELISKIKAEKDEMELSGEKQNIIEKIDLMSGYEYEKLPEYMKKLFRREIENRNQESNIIPEGYSAIVNQKDGKGTKSAHHIVKANKPVSAPTKSPILRNSAGRKKSKGSSPTPAFKVYQNDLLKMMKLAAKFERFPAIETPVDEDRGKLKQDNDGQVSRKAKKKIDESLLLKPAEIKTDDKKGIPFWIIHSFPYEQKLDFRRHIPFFKTVESFIPKPPKDPMNEISPAALKEMLATRTFFCIRCPMESTKVNYYPFRIENSDELELIKQEELRLFGEQIQDGRGPRPVSPLKSSSVERKAREANVKKKLKRGSASAKSMGSADGKRRRTSASKRGIRRASETHIVPQELPKLTLEDFPEPPPKMPQRLVTRYTLQPGDSVSWKVIFQPQGCYFYRQCVSLGLAGAPGIIYPVIITGASDIPSVDFNATTIFRRILNDDNLETVTKPCFWLQKNGFHFGPVLVSTAVNRRGCEKYSSFKFLNISRVDVKLLISYNTEAESDNEPFPAFGCEQKELSIPIGESRSVRVFASPPSHGFFDNVFIFSIQNNPEPFFIRVFCQGVQPNIQFDPPKIHFGKVLVFRHVSKKVSLQNTCEIPLVWSLTRLTPDLGDMTISKETGFLPPGGIDTFFVDYQPLTIHYMTKQFNIQIWDDEKRHYPLIQHLYTVTLESYDVEVEIKCEGPEPNHLCFGAIKINQQANTIITLFNKGSHEVTYRISFDYSSWEAQVCRDYRVFTLSATNGKLIPKDAAMIKVGMKSPRTICVNKVTMLAVRLFDSGDDLIAKIPIAISGSTHCSQFKIYPENELNFGTMEIGTKKILNFVIENIGPLEFVTVIISTSPPELEEAELEMRATSAGGRKSSKKKSFGIPKKSLDSETRKTAVKKPVDDIDLKMNLSKLLEEPFYKKSGSKKGQEESGVVSKKSVVRSSRSGQSLPGSGRGISNRFLSTLLQVSAFKLNRNSASILPNTSLVIEVECTPTESKQYREELMIGFSEACPEFENGIFYYLNCIGCSATLDFTNISSIFRQMEIVDCFTELSDLPVFNKGEPFGAYSKATNCLHFGNVVIGTSHRLEVFFSNHGMVTSTATAKIEDPNNNYNKLDSTSFTFDGDTNFKLYAEPYKTVSVPITFSPLQLKEYSARVTISLNKFSNSRSERYQFSLNGVGQVPLIKITEPVPQEKPQQEGSLFPIEQDLPKSIRKTISGEEIGEHTMDFGLTVIGLVEKRPFHLKNVGNVMAKVLVEPIFSGTGFWISPKEETLKYLQNVKDTQGPLKCTIEIDLSPGDEAKFLVFFSPTSSEESQLDLRVHTINNPYETLSMLASGEGLQDKVTIEGLKIFKIDKDSYAYALNLGTCPVDKIKTESFTIVNMCDTIIRFSVTASHGDRTAEYGFIPTHGHAMPGGKKEIFVQFKTLQASSLKIMFLITYKLIEYVKASSSPGFQWDDSMTLVRWMKENQQNSILEPGVLARIEENVPEPAFVEVLRDNEQLDSLPGCLTVVLTSSTDRPCLDLDPIMIQFGGVVISQSKEEEVNIYNLSRVGVDYTLSITDQVILPVYYKEEIIDFTFGKFDLNILSLTESPKKIIRIVDVPTIVPSYSWPDEEVNKHAMFTNINDKGFSYLPATLGNSPDILESEPWKKPILETPFSQGCLKKKNGQQWDQLRSTLASSFYRYQPIVNPFLSEITEELTIPCEKDVFSLGSSERTIEGLEVQQRHIKFSPRNTHKHGATLRLVNEETKEVAEIKVEGEGCYPLCHVEIEEDVVYSEPRLFSCITPQTKTVIVTTFDVGVVIIKKFNVYNLSDIPYSFNWNNELNSDRPFKETVFKCITPHGRIESKRMFEMEFAFMAYQYGSYESLWMLRIKEFCLELPILFVGISRDPKIRFEPNAVNLLPVLKGFKTTGSVKLLNSEDTPITFEIIEKSLHSTKDLDEFLTVFPLSGQIEPKSQIEFSVELIPEVPKDGLFDVQLQLGHSKKIVELKVMSKCYAIVPIVVCELENLKKIQINYINNEDRINNIDLGNLFIRIPHKVIFHMTNAGAPPLYYEIYMLGGVKDYVTFEICQSSKMVPPLVTDTFSVIITPLFRVSFSEVMVIKVLRGPQFEIVLNGNSVVPCFSFSFLSCDFGPCLIQTADSALHQVLLKFHNMDSETLLLEKKSEEPEWLSVEFTSCPVAPRTTVEIPIRFNPSVEKIYNGSLELVVNDIYSNQFSIAGEGVPFKLELKNPEDLMIDLGAVEVGTEVIREIHFINQSRVPLPINFRLEQDEAVYSSLEGTGSSFGIQSSQLDGEGTETIPAGFTGYIVLNFRPFQRQDLCIEKLKYSCYSHQGVLSTIQGRAIGMQLELDQEVLSFGATMIGCSNSLKVALLNNGELGTRFSLDIKFVSSVFSITPMEGYSSAGSVVTFEVTFVPNDFVHSVKNEVLFNLEKHPSLKLVLMGISVALPQPSEWVTFRTPVRKAVVNSVFLTNKSNNEWVVYPVLTGKYFYGQEIVKINPRFSFKYEITYKPMVTSKPTHLGNIFFGFPNGEGVLYELEGRTDEPEEEATLHWEIPAKTHYKCVWPITNWETVRKTARYSVVVELMTDQNKVYYEATGAPYLIVPPDTERNYELTFIAYKEAHINFKVSFIDEEQNELMWYNIQVEVTAPAPLGPIEFHTFVRRPSVKNILFRNPTEKETTLIIKSPLPEIELGTTKLRLQPLQEESVPITYLPLIPAVQEEHLLTATSPELGLFPYCLIISAKEAPPEPIIYVRGSLGCSEVISLQLRNLTSGKKEFECKSDDLDLTVQTTVKAHPRDVTTVRAIWEPTEMGTKTISVLAVNEEAGTFLFPVNCVCSEPQPLGPFPLKPHATRKIVFKNIFGYDCKFTCFTNVPAFIINKSHFLLRPKQTATLEVQLATSGLTEIFKEFPLTGKITITAASLIAQPIQWVYYIKAILRK